MMDTMKEIGAAIRAQRKKRDLTLQQVHHLTGVHHTNLSRMESGRQAITTDVMIRLATAYGITLGELLANVTVDTPAAAVLLPELGVTSAGEAVMDEGRKHAFVLADVSLAGTTAAALSVPDDAMAPLLMPGDVVLIDMNDTKIHTTGGVFGIAIDGQPAIRRLFPAPAGIIVQTENQLYPNLHMSAESAQALRILGRVKVARRRSGF
jgi:transcriptional regulator with XRE-family HTH domain